MLSLRNRRVEFLKPRLDGCLAEPDPASLQGCRLGVCGWRLDGILIRQPQCGSMRRHRPRYVSWVGLLIVAGFVFIIATFFYTAIAHAGD